MKVLPVEGLLGKGFRALAALEDVAFALYEEDAGIYV